MRRLGSPTRWRLGKPDAWRLGGPTRGEERGDSGPRVGLVVGFFHSFDGDLGVDLGGTEAGMTEQ